MLEKLDGNEKIKGIPVAVMNDAQLSSYKTNVAISVLVNRVLLFTANRLREYQTSSVGVFSGIYLFLYMWFLIVLSFTAINYATYKINSINFSLTSAPEIFTFFRYSFYNVFNSSINEITASTQISQSLAMVETVFSVSTFVVFAGIMVSTLGSAYNLELGELIRKAEHESQNAEDFIRKEFGLPSVDDALIELENLKSDMIRILIYMTEHMDRT